MDAVELWWCPACQCYHFDDDVEVRKQNKQLVILCKQTNTPVTLVDTWELSAEQATARVLRAQAVGDTTNVHD